MKNFLFLFLISSFILNSCSPDDTTVYPFGGYKINYLKYYYEDNRLVQSFEYDKDRLIKLSIYGDDDEVSTTEFIYSGNGMVDSAYIREKNIVRDLAFVYEDTLVKEFEVWSRHELRHRILFDRDNKGRITHMTLISLTYGILRRVKFMWEGPNISKFETTIYDGFYNHTYVYEFIKYDQFWNPYNFVFESVGFNFIDFVPLSENNWVEMIYYNKDDYEGSKVTYINKFSYYGRYPGVNELIQQDSKNRSQIYVEYNYSNTLH